MECLYNTQIFRPVAQSWLERRIDIAEVDGSSPFGSTNLLSEGLSPNK
jgi:hypothetical protein